MPVSDAEFYTNNAQALMRLTTALVGPADAEDVFSTALTSAMRSSTWQKLADSDAQRAYVYRCIVNQAKTAAKHRTRRRRAEHLFASLSSSSVQLAERPELLEAISTLSVRQRAAIFLTYWEDLDTKQVAEFLGCSEGSVYQHLNRARSALRSRVDG